MQHTIFCNATYLFSNHTFMGERVIQYAHMYGINKFTRVTYPLCMCITICMRAVPVMMLYYDVQLL